MKRLAVISVLTLLPARAFAQTSVVPEEPTPAPQADENGAATSDLLLPTPAEWKMSYDDARAKLVTGEFADAAVRFADLERSAVNRLDRALAREQGSLASEWARRRLAFVQRSDLGESNASARAVDKRTTDELVSLYTNAVLYGLGSGGFLATLTEPKSVAGGVLPAIALTGASVGAVIALDAGRGFRYGVPQSIVSGLYIGLENGIVWGIWAANRDDSKWTGKEEATFIWALSSVGAVGGGVLGAALGTTPGRASWVGSTTLWSGALLGLAAGAFSADGDSPQASLAAAGVGLSAGTLVGLATASRVSPSIARVRFLDLGGVSGGLLAAGIYLSAANDSSNGHVASGLTSLGVAGGLATAWALTSSMTEDRPHTPSPGESTSTSAGDPAPRRRLTAMDQLQPRLIPANSGAMVGVGGILD